MSGRKKMANEKRLIDANALVKDLELLAKHEDSFRQSVILGVVHTAKAQPTVSAVEVVWCKDCKHCEMCYPRKKIGEEAEQAWHCRRYKEWKKPDDFCSYGERIEDDGNG